MMNNENKQKNFVSAVIYVHNNACEIVPFVKVVASVLETNFEKSEIICVNDFSSDDSVLKIKRLCTEISNVCISILNMSFFHGVEVAMTAGVDLAIGDFVFEFDSATLDFEASEIMKVYRKSLEGFDIVSASPNKTIRTSSRFFYSIFNRFANLNYKMTTERFRILSRRVINRISTINRTMPYRKPVYAACGLKTASLTYITTAKVSEPEDYFIKKYRLALAEDSLIIFTNLGYGFSMAISFAMLVFTLGVGIYSLVYRLLKNPISGWTSTILLISTTMFFVFALLTIVLKYLQILVNLVFKKERYCFDSIDKLTK